ncbi:hypothetical protein CMV00_02080 [Elizabethkingia anophelis]|nr:hypothetical protein [Elizabethkingia anophelis]
MRPFPIYTIIVFFILMTAFYVSIFSLIILGKKQKEMMKEFRKTIYLKIWYKEIAEKVYGKNHIEEKEKEFLKNYNL